MNRGLGLDMLLLFECQGRTIEMFPKGADKMGRILKARFNGYFVDIEISGFQKVFGIIESFAFQPLSRACSISFCKVPIKGR